MADLPGHQLGRTMDGIELLDVTSAPAQITVKSIADLGI